MKSGYESLRWLNDEEGREYVCTISDDSEKNTFEELTEEEKNHCENVNQIVGTERW